MSWSNYPPGVTGGEYEIAGADDEWEEERDCEACGKRTTWYRARYRHETWGTCTECGLSQDFSQEEEDHSG